MSPTESPGSATGSQDADLTPPRTFMSEDRARASLPTREQLRGLAVAAGERPLTAAEVHLLLLGISALASQLERAGGQIRELRTELAETVKALEAARLELAKDLAAECGYCGAVVGEGCVSPVDGSPVASHTARVYALLRRLEVAS